MLINFTAMDENPYEPPPIPADSRPRYLSGTLTVVFLLFGLPLLFALFGWLLLAIGGPR